MTTQLILIIEDQLTRRSDERLLGQRRHLLRSGQTLIVGRDPEQAEILVESDAALSAAHFQLTCDTDGCRLLDLGSKHGTLQNGHPVQEVQLADGDHLLAGETHFVVQLISMPPRAGVPAEVPARRSKPTAPSEVKAAEANSGVKSPIESPKLRLLLQIVQQAGDSRALASRLFTSILPGETIVVGRVPDRSDLCFSGDHEMSGAHLEFSCGADNCRLRDLNSTNGTFLNGQQMSNLLLENGDEIRAGRTYFVVQLNSKRARRDSNPKATAHIAQSQEDRKEKRRISTGYQTVNRTPFPLAPITGRVNFPGHSLTLIVKGTFQLRAGLPAVPLDEQPFPTGDLPFDGDDDPKSPPRYESDFAFRKPRADILLVGHCHSPEEKAVRRLRVGLQVGEQSRWLEVFGKRSWRQERGDWKTTDPEPFTSLPLNYANSFGGPECEANPSGIGHTNAKRRSSDNSLPLPQIEDPESLLQSPLDTAEPAGFGPLGKWYGRRCGQLGTYDKAWQRLRFPWFPSNFEWGHFNAAPEALQAEGYLRGDEILTLTNLHPRHPLYQSQLPGIRIRCFVNPLGQEFCEVNTQLDTLWIDMDAEQAVLLWRGDTPVASEECENIRHVFVLSQPLNEAQWSLNECHAMLLNELSGREARFNPPPEHPPDESAKDDSGPSEDQANSAEDVAATEQIRVFETELARTRAKISETQVAAGFDPELFDRQVQAEEARLIRELGLDSDIPPMILAGRVNAEYTRLKKQIQDAQIAAGLTPEPLPDELIHVPREIDASEAAATASWTREKVMAHHANGGSFAGQDLSGLNLTGLDLSGGDFEAAILTKVKFSRSLLVGAKFTLANLAGADLSEAKLQNAVLDHADLTEAVLHQTVLDEVHAHGAIFSSSWLTAASLRRADATGACFTQCDLTDAVLNGAKLNSANFADARMARANLQSSSLVEANLETATGHDAVFDHADLTRVRASGCDFSGARFHQVRGVDSIWEKSLLKAADFSYAQLPGTNFIRANLEKARLMAADMTGCRLTKASLKGAVVTDVKLFEAGLQQADFTGADLSRSNLYSADVHGAIWSDTQREGVNWKMTKLAGEMAAKAKENAS